MRGKHLAIGLLVAMLFAVGVIFWIGLSGGSTHVPASERAHAEAGHEDGAAGHPEKDGKAHEGTAP